MRDFGILITPDAKLQRTYFEQMVKLRGVYVEFQYPLGNKTYTTQGELITGYSDPCKVGCIFEEIIPQKTARKLGWDSELQDGSAMIHLPYDLPNLQVGSLVKIPSAFENTDGRLFRITRMSAMPIYPSSIACEIVPEYCSTTQSSEINLFKNSDFNLLYEGD